MQITWGQKPNGIEFVFKVKYYILLNPLHFEKKTNVKTNFTQKLLVYFTNNYNQIKTKESAGNRIKHDILND